MEKPVIAIVGRPNVGKSTLLSVTSDAKPKIANYHFTTLSPNLGVVSAGEGQGFLAADIPGLIEGASEGQGLGHAFLRHVDRCRLLLHVVDIAGTDGRDPVDDIEKINYELKKYSEELSERPQILVANKVDSADMESESVLRFKEYAAKLGIPVIYVSAVTGEGLDALVEFLADDEKELEEMRRK